MDVRIVNDRGELKISINGKLYPALGFKSFRPNPRNISEFYDAGVRLFCVLSSGIISGLGIPYSLFGESWVGDGEYDFDPIDRQMDMFIENAPDAYFAPMFQLDTRPWYLEENPGTPNTFTHLSQIAGDEIYRAAAAEYLKAAVRHCEEKYGDRIYGYYLLGGTTTEWFSDFDYEASHPIKEKAYKKWCGDEAVSLPKLEDFNRPGGNFLGEAESEVARARQFHAELISDLVLHFAKETQTIINHKKLLGMYFGYLFELGTPRLHNAGQLAYEKVFMSPYIDIIASPSSYGFRRQTDPSAFMLTQKTLYAHNKLYFLEFDHRTHTTPDRINEHIFVDSPNCMFDGSNFPGSHDRCKNDTESLNLLYRDYLLCRANGAALWWFDMLDGWFRSEKMMGAIKHIIELNEKISSHDKHGVAEVAVFAEGQSMYHVRKSSPIASACLSGIRRTLAEMGAPYDIYSISDIGLPIMENYRFFIFVNQYDIPDDIMANIKKYCHKSGKTVLWLYAPDYAHGGKNDAGRISAITGMKIEESLNPHGALVFEGKKVSPDNLGPYFAVKDEHATPVAFYEDGQVAVAETTVNGCRSIYAGTYNPPSELIRRLLSGSGVFVYSENPLVYTYVNNAFIGVYNASGGTAQINVKEDGEYLDLIENGKYTAEGGRLTVPAKDINAYMLVKL